MMKQWEKEFIAKIQISQLVSDKPWIDDYYYSAFTRSKQSNSEVPEISEKEESPNPRPVFAPMNP